MYLNIIAKSNSIVIFGIILLYYIFFAMSIN